MRFGSLFAGIGGFDLGLERAGMACAWQCEIDRQCRDVLTREWPTVKRYEDVTTMDPANVEPVDLICGGFPCQDVSIAGKRAGLAGERTGLFYEIIRLAAGLRPRWLLLENVPGLLTSNRGRDFAAVLLELGNCGYGVSWRVLDSQYFGLAQRRKRVFIVGYLGGKCPPEVLFEREGLRGSAAPRQKAQGEIAASLVGRAGKGIKASALEAHYAKQSNSPTQTYIPVRAATLGGSAHGASSQKDSRTNDMLIASTLGCGGSFSGNNEPRGYIADRCPPSDRNGVRKAARIPRRLDEISGSARYKMIGNAVSVPVAERIGRRILAVDRKLKGGSNVR